MITLNTASRFSAHTIGFGSANRLAIILALSIGMLGAAATQAETSSRGSSLQVNLADLDLTTRDGRQSAEERMHQAARKACARVADDLDLSHHENYLKCVDVAVATAGERLQAMIDRQSTSTLARADVK